MITSKFGTRVAETDAAGRFVVPFLRPASYEVRLPLSLSVVEVLVAGRVELRLDVQYLSPPFRRELSLSGEQGR